MTAIVALALKDLRLLARNRAALFFALVWPLIVAILFGVVFSGGGGASGKPRVAIADLDHSPGSATFVSELSAIEELETDVLAEADARDLVILFPVHVPARRRAIGAVKQADLQRQAGRLHPDRAVGARVRRDAEDQPLAGIEAHAVTRTGRVRDPDRRRRRLPVGRRRSGSAQQRK